jgi:hypothetical protein
LEATDLLALMFVLGLGYMIVPHSDGGLITFSFSRLDRFVCQRDFDPGLHVHYHLKHGIFQQVTHL